MEDRLLYTVVSTSIILALIIVFFVVSVIRYHRRYISLQKDMIRAEITMQELERKRIANDLHDSLGPLLSSVKLYMQSLEDIGEDNEALLDIANTHIDETINGLRQISYNLSPESLSRNGLVKATSEYLSRINSDRLLEIDFNSDDDGMLPKDIEIHLFRIIQEIVNNTMKHARATKLKLIIASTVNQVTLRSTDNGIGFDAQNVEKNKRGLGLSSIKSRCEILNAQLSVNSAVDQGCSYVIKVPF
ncbi:sensor histidine kinase [Mucilaginibacter sp. JRF]|uniref:sensor histidine kinase n=1 Tax=Mucilaginibacter sp. JRF TaxID=2780088 RepID=UPI00187FBE40|nr:ATP-binding protein [Mucilaginibacter sp. JRF]MBE9583368.1 sensor histidine kinase [Mucilaginibacter sp. JRF]